MNSRRALETLAILLPLSHAAVVPSLAPREEIHRDVIRYMKCAGLVTSKPDVGGWERGMAAYWPNEATGGAPPERVEFDMYTAMEDYFYNSHGSVYGGDGNQNTKIWVDFKDPGVIKPPNGIYIGHAERTSPTETFGYNCYTEDTFTYEDEKYGTCYNYASCVQKDALKVFIKGSEDTVRVENMATDIFEKISERYDPEQRLCDTTPIELSPSGFKVSFDCGDNDEEGKVMDILINEMKNVGKSAQLWKEDTVWMNPTCDPATDGCSSPGPEAHLFRSVPKVIQFVARGIPQTSGRKGYEVAHVTATLEYEDPNKEALCDALKAIFGLVALVPKFEQVGGLGGVIAEMGCGIVNSDDDE